ncbi:BLUF domain-containing protein [Arenicella xantha]|uniref:FAD-dependent sensor of blue light n=1 Tax=Arenicella xantha TaxID=644221 RepID=A0A395JHN3_9GAMM|nr:BLUF domain-containing protein [Arenicella xantha]RBP49596.1 FAD-dependent sensor of blue light [Arenicella xantha]
MKCIAYISEVIARKNGATLPVGLSNIFSTARKKNAELKVTGILSYRLGRYIQVIEGEASSVDQLFNSIRLDKRHSNVRVILDTKVTSRSFPEWDMKLAENISKVPEFKRFLSKHASTLNTLAKEDRELLQIFLDSPQGRNTPSATQQPTFEGLALQLSAWPDFNHVGQSPMVYELCAQLIRHSVPYSELVKNKQLGSKAELDKLLGTLYSLDILTASKIQGDHQSDRTTATNGGFYAKMRSFLRLT